MENAALSGDALPLQQFAERLKQNLALGSWSLKAPSSFNATIAQDPLTDNDAP